MSFRVSTTSRICHLCWRRRRRTTEEEEEEENVYSYSSDTVEGPRVLRGLRVGGHGLD